MRSDLHEIEVVFQHQTERAVCIRKDEDGEDIWIPLSQCEIGPSDGHLQRGRVAILTAPERILLEKGLI